MVVKSRIIALVVYAASAAAIASARSAPTVDHRPDRLSPLTFIPERFRALIEEKLLLTPANCGRMISFPGAENAGESAVSVYCADVDAPDSPCQVTITRVAGNFGVALSEHRDDDDPLRSARNLEVDRRDAPIPHSIALLFRSSLLALMPTEGDTPQTRTISDNDRIEFWLALPDGTTRGAERGERFGKRVKSLIRMGELFVHYCNAPPSKRGKVLKRIEGEGAMIRKKTELKSVK